MLITLILLLLTLSEASQFIPAETEPYYNLTTANPPAPTTITGPCQPNCTYDHRGEFVHGWTSIPTVTISHAIEYHIINNRTNNTKTWTSYFEGQSSISKTFSTNPTNSAGTRTYEITISKPTGPVGKWLTFVTTIAYPSRYTKYPPGYTWWGELATTDSSGGPVCSWAPYYFSAIPTTTFIDMVQSGPYTDYSTVASGAYVPYQTLEPIGEDTQEIDPEDPGGIKWDFDDVGIYALEITAVPPPYDEDAAVNLCKKGGVPKPPNPVAALSGGFRPGVHTSEEYLTLTSTIHEDTSILVAEYTPNSLETLPADQLSDQTKTSQRPKQQSAPGTASSTKAHKQSLTTTAAATARTLSVSQVQYSDKVLTPSSHFKTCSCSSSSSSLLSTSMIAPPPLSQAKSSFSAPSNYPESYSAHQHATSSALSGSANSNIIGEIIPHVASRIAFGSEKAPESLAPAPTTAVSTNHQQQSGIFTSNGGRGSSISTTATSTLSPVAPSSSSLLAGGTVGAAEDSGAGTASSTTPTAVVVGPATLSQIANAAASSSSLSSFFSADLSHATSSDAGASSATRPTSRSSGAVVAIIGGQTLSSIGQKVTLSGGNDATGASSEAVGASTQQEEQQPTLAVLQTDSAGHTQLLVGGSTVVSDVQGAYATGAATVDAMDGVLTGTTAAVTSAADTVQGQGQGQGQGRGTTTTVGGQSVEAANSTGAGEVETSAFSTSGGQTVQASATSKTVSVQTESESKTTTSAPGSSDGADSGVATAGGVASEASAAAGVVVGQTVFGSLIGCWWVLVLL